MANGTSKLAFSEYFGWRMRVKWWKTAKKYTHVSRAIAVMHADMHDCNRVACPMTEHHPWPNTENNHYWAGVGLVNKDSPMAGHMLSYHRLLGNEKLRFAFFIVPTSDIGFMFGHGSIREFLYKYFVHLFSGRSLLMKV